MIHSDIKKAEFEELLNRMDDLTDEERDIVRDRLDNPVPDAECEETSDISNDACPDDKSPQDDSDTEA